MESYTFIELFQEQLHDLIGAEELTVNFIPQLISVTSSNELQEHLDRYLQATRLHREHLNEIFLELNLESRGFQCRAIEGVIEEGNRVIHHGGNSPVKDAAAIAICQRMQHYKMAVYGTARTYARHLNFNRAMDALQRALNEEAASDRALTHLAEGGVFKTGINEEAVRSKIYT